jgi:hypothetical protein
MHAYQLLLLSAVALQSPQGLAQPLCTGDCDGNGAVTVSELVRGVAIALGNQALDQCPAFDRDADEQVTVDELLRAVADALYGCGVTPPTPRATFTPTPTPTPTSVPSLSPSLTHTPAASPTSTRTPGPPSVAGAWREDQVTLGSSTCAAEINDILREELAGLGSCDYAVSQNGTRIHAVDCDGESAEGTIDEMGSLRLQIPPFSQTVETCTITGTTAITIDMSHSPTTATYDLGFTFSRSCHLGNCSMTVTSRWTRL